MVFPRSPGSAKKPLSAPALDRCRRHPVDPFYDPYYGPINKLLTAFGMQEAFVVQRCPGRESGLAVDILSGKETLKSPENKACAMDKTEGRSGRREYPENPLSSVIYRK